jgi:hypothetical protein
MNGSPQWRCERVQAAGRRHTINATPPLEVQMPPFLITALFTLILQIIAPHSNVVLPHLVPDMERPVIVASAE